MTEAGYPQYDGNMRGRKPILVQRRYKQWIRHWSRTIYAFALSEKAMYYSEAEARSWFEQCLANLRAGRAYDVGIFAADGGELLGGVGINQLNVQHNFGNVGYWVRHSHQRRRVATRAVRIMGGYGFNLP